MDKKALKREYKETQRPMGVYRVRNTGNGMALIGSSVDLTAILNRHRAALRMGAHANKTLQKHWNELGPDAFEFEVLDTLTPPDTPGYKPANDLRELEQLWIDRENPEYNKEK